MEETPPPELPKWTKPLTTVTDCVERIDTDAYVFDWDQRLQALTFLTERKQELGFDFEFTVPQGEHWLTRTKDPVWDRVVSLTEDRCGCGQHRVIVGGGKTSEVVAEDKAVVASIGRAVDLVPRGLNRRQTLMRVSVEEHGGQTFMRHLSRPYTSSINFAELFAPKGYLLDKLAEALARQKEPARLMEKDWALCAIHAVDPIARTVTIRPNATFDAVNLGYEVVLARDAMTGFPPEYTDVIIEHTLSLVATITTTDDLVAAWGAVPTTG